MKTAQPTTTSAVDKQDAAAATTQADSIQEDVETHRAKLRELYDSWRSKFPGVSAIDAPTLRGRMEKCMGMLQLPHQKQEGPGRDIVDDKGDKLLVVDVRTPEEQQVSVLPGSCVLMKPEFEARKAELAGKGYSVVVYCTAGYRSGLYAAELQKEGGWSEVLNLEGSILAWTQEGYSLVELTNREQETRRVHVYGPSWALQGKGYEPVVFKQPMLKAASEFVPKWMRWW